MKLFLISLCFLAGCMPPIEGVLQECPGYVQENVGEIRYMPVSWGTVMLMSGVTNKRTGEIWLTALADRHTLLHEVAHSVYFRVQHDEFDRQFRREKDWISIWAIGHNETVAEAFVEGMKGRRNPKIDCAMRFFNGNKQDNLRRLP